jgi:hypothetical protein
MLYNVSQAEFFHFLSPMSCFPDFEIVIMEKQWIEEVVKKKQRKDGKHMIREKIGTFFNDRLNPIFNTPIGFQLTDKDKDGLYNLQFDYMIS